MARSPKDDRRFNEMQHNTWNYQTEGPESHQTGGLTDRPVSRNSAALNENMFGNANFNTPNDVYLNKHFYNVRPSDNLTNNEENMAFNNMNNVPNVNRQNMGNAMLNLGNGKLVRVFYDENNQQLIFPMSGQYELFNHNQGIRELPLQSSQPSHMFTLNQEYSKNNAMNMQPLTTKQNVQNNVFKDDNSNQNSSVPTSSFINEVICNWEPNATGTYSPFGQNYPLNHPDATPLNILNNNPITEPFKSESSPKRNENSPLADTTNKKRIVAEVKPMRPSYSDVLAKNTKNNSPTETTRKIKTQSIESKPSNNKTNSKPDKMTGSIKNNDEMKHKNDKKLQTSIISSGSESGDVNADDADKRQKPNKKSKNKRSNMSRKWSSLDDITNEEELFNQNSESQFVFIESQSEKPPKKEKKQNDNKSKNTENKFCHDDDFEMDIDDIDSQFEFQESPSEITKARKRKEARTHQKPIKPTQDKKKVIQNKWKRNKPGYLGLAQNYLENWGGATWKAVVWFFYLLSDICHMSTHLTFDLCTSVFTQTYVSSQAVWRSIKDWVSKIGNNKALLYIDKKLGHTKLGFWRKLKWFKKEPVVTNNADHKLNANIPLPATGEEAMKRLLACKGKDPYSILGVSVSCTDEEIKRYYKRQAFLVHPDKNQQPGAEEAFKILQHAFNLIGEPELREAFERRALESLFAEAAFSELSQLLAKLQDKMESAANTIRCTNCGRRHKRVLTERPCYAARYCVQCKIRHSAKEGDIWAESSMFGLLVMYYACMDGAVYQITQWASCQKKNLKQLRPDWHVVQYRIVLGNKAPDLAHKPPSHDPNLEEFLNNLYTKSGGSPAAPNTSQPAPDNSDIKKRRNKKNKP